jgi:ligand-binding sensor domain-containing protein
MGNLWFGTNGGGVSRYDGGAFLTFSTAQGLANNMVVSIMEDREGNLWFGTGGGGVSRYDGKSFTTFTTDQGLASNAVFSIMQDDKGNLWFGTSEGLSVMTSAEATRFDSFLEVVKRRGKNNDIAQHSRYPGAHMFKSFTKTDGLPDNFVTQVLQMPNGEMIIGTNIGIAQFFISKDFKQLNDLEVYNSGTNCPVKDVNAGQNGMYLDRKGIIWAGTGSEKHALVRFDPSALRKNKDKPTILFENKDYNRNVSTDEILKFERDIQKQQHHGIFISQKTPITFKDNFQID